ncbi:hypothetical protein [Taibaiella koreensis]|uniref:hypothetical protein n=1 Tax=Taibaiella koreensis TaxID=1268548 RepID=UPI000E59FE45|nr:hypothetical protein [Taibaiella koreensis]
MEFETMGCKKFSQLSHDEMILVKGGGDTGGGSSVIGVWTVQVPCASQNGGVEYRTEQRTKIRTWTSDAIAADGGACYWGEGFGWI